MYTVNHFPYSSLETLFPLHKIIFFSRFWVLNFVEPDTLEEVEGMFRVTYVIFCQFFIKNRWVQCIYSYRVKTRFTHHLYPSLVHRCCYCICNFSGKISGGRGSKIDTFKNQSIIFITFFDSNKISQCFEWLFLVWF